MARASASMLAKVVSSSAAVFSSRLAVISLKVRARYPISSWETTVARCCRSPAETARIDRRELMAQDLTGNRCRGQRRGQLNAGQIVKRRPWNPSGDFGDGLAEQHGAHDAVTGSPNRSHPIEHRLRRLITEKGRTLTG